MDGKDYPYSVPDPGTGATRQVWACCESSIGPACQHVAGTRYERKARVESRVKPWAEGRRARIGAAGRLPTGYCDLMSDIRTAGDFYDPWGTTMAWMCAIADVVHVVFDDVLPEYSPSVALTSRDGLELGDWPTQCVLSGVDSGTLGEDDLRAAYATLNRYADWLIKAGRDY